MGGGLQVPWDLLCPLGRLSPTGALRVLFPLWWQQTKAIPAGDQVLHHKVPSPGVQCGVARRRALHGEPSYDLPPPPVGGHVRSQVQGPQHGCPHTSALTGLRGGLCEAQRKPTRAAPAVLEPLVRENPGGWEVRTIKTGPNLHVSPGILFSPWLPRQMRAHREEAA